MFLSRTSDDAIVMVDTAGRIMDINPKALEYADLGQECLSVKHLRQFFPGGPKLSPSIPSLKGTLKSSWKSLRFPFLEFKVVINEGSPGS